MGLQAALFECDCGMDGMVCRCRDEWTLKDNIEPYLVDVGYLRLGMLRV